MLTLAQNFLLSQVRKHEMLLEIKSKEDMIANIQYQEERESFLNVESIKDGVVHSDVQSLESIQDTIYGLSACKYASQTAIFDLKGIASDTELADDNEQQVVQVNGGANSFLFNFCEMNIDGDLVPTKCDQVNTYAYGFVTGTQDQCTSILKTSDAKPNTVASDIKDDTSEYVNGVKLTFESGAATCPSDSSKQLKLAVEVRCSDDNALVLDTTETNENDPCDITLKYKSTKGCSKFQYGILAKFLSEYSYLFGAVLIVFGLLLAFCGNKFITVVISLVTALAVCIFGIYLTSMFVDSVFKPENVWEYSVWIILGIWVIIGILAGVFIGKKRKWGIAVVGAFGGVMLGLLLTTIFGSMINNAVVYYLIIASCGILAFIIAFKVEKFVMIISTSFIGSYFIVRGISMYAGGFPNETQLHTMVRDGLVDWSSFPKIFFAYLAGIVVLTIGTTIFQWKTNKNKESKNEMRSKY